MSEEIVKAVWDSFGSEKERIDYIAGIVNAAIAAMEQDQKMNGNMLHMRSYLMLRDLRSVLPAPNESQ